MPYLVLLAGRMPTSGKYWLDLSLPYGKGTVVFM